MPPLSPSRAQARTNYVRSYTHQPHTTITGPAICSASGQNRGRGSCACQAKTVSLKPVARKPPLRSRRSLNLLPAEPAAVRRSFIRCSAVCAISVRCSRVGDHHSFRAISVREEALEVFDLRQIVKDYVRIGWVQRQEILMIVLGGIERSVGLDGRDDRRVRRVRPSQLSNIRLGNSHGSGATYYA